MDKEAFYEQLQATLESVHRRDLLVMGDLNAKLGSKNVNYERLMGREWCGVQSDHRERLTQWCAFNNMIIGELHFHMTASTNSPGPLGMGGIRTN